MAKGVHVITLIDNEHREAADDIEAGHEGNESQEEEGKEFLDFHHVKSALLLFVAVHYFERRAGQLLQSLFDISLVSVRL